MGEQAHLSLVKRPPEDSEPLTATALRQRLQTQAAAVATLADEWATREEPISFGCSRVQIHRQRFRSVASGDKHCPASSRDPRPNNLDPLRSDLIMAFIPDVSRSAPISFKDFEKALRNLVFAFARVAIMLFLALREETVIRTYPSQMECAGRRFRRAPAIPRSLTTLFGVVRYARTYMREVGHDARRGFHPLDVAIGLVGDRFS